MKKILLTLIIVSLSLAQVASDYTYTSAEATSLVGAVTANPGSEASLFHNPAGLAEIDYQLATFGAASIFGVSHSYLGVIVNTPWIGNLGIALQQSKTEQSGKTLSEEQSLGFSGGYFLQKDKNSQLSVGYSLNFLNWSLGRTAGITGDGSDGMAGASGSTVGIDIGFQAQLRGKHRVGAYFKNVNSPVLGKGESQQNLPRRLALGVSYTPYKGLITSLVFDRLLGYDTEVKSGIQYAFNEKLTFRLGIQSNPNRMGGGFSIHMNKYNLDYALLTHPVLPVTQQISIGWKF